MMLRLYPRAGMKARTSSFMEFNVSKARGHSNCIWHFWVSFTTCHLSLSTHIGNLAHPPPPPPPPTPPPHHHHHRHHHTPKNNDKLIARKWTISRIRP